MVNFNASNGWLQKWKNRHNICDFRISGEDGGDASAGTLKSWAERLPVLVKGYELKDVLNADETGLYWRALPGKSLSVKGKKCKGGKN